MGRGDGEQAVAVKRRDPSDPNEQLIGVFESLTDRQRQLILSDLDAKQLPQLRRGEAPIVDSQSLRFLQKKSEGLDPLSEAYNQLLSGYVNVEQNKRSSHLGQFIMVDDAEHHYRAYVDKPFSEQLPAPAFHPSLLTKLINEPQLTYNAQPFELAGKSSGVMQITASDPEQFLDIESQVAERLNTLQQQYLVSVAELPVDYHAEAEQVIDIERSYEALLFDAAPAPTKELHMIGAITQICQQHHLEGVTITPAQYSIGVLHVNGPQQNLYRMQQILQTTAELAEQYLPTTK